MSLLEILSQVAGGSTVNQLSRQLGADEATTEKAIAGALPLLIDALSRNASSEEGAQALAHAVARDHDGSILDNANAFLNLDRTDIGEAILGHVLGGRRGNVESGLSQLSGLDPGAVGKLLALLAPLVMGALGRQQRSRGLDPGDLASMLNREKEVAVKKAPGAAGMLGSLLDQDGDGQVADDLARMGAGLLSSFLNQRR